MKIFAASLLMLGFALLQGCGVPSCGVVFIEKGCGSGDRHSRVTTAREAAFWQAEREARAARAAEAAKPTPLQLASDAEVCKTGINQTTKLLYTDVPSAWVEEANAWVEEAKGRNLTLDDCRKIIFDAATDKEVCRSAVAMNGEWETNPHLIGWKTEAMQRGFTTQSCTPIVLSEHTDKSICMFSIRSDRWTTEDLFYVNEAKRRGLSPAKCKLL